MKKEIEYDNKIFENNVEVTLTLHSIVIFKYHNYLFYT